jgi:anti-anti-sigma factor
VGFTVRSETAGDDVVLHVAGDLDMATVPELRAAVEDAAAAPRVVVDLSGLTFCDSTGLALLLETRKAAAAAGREVVVRNPSEPFRRVAELVRLDEVLGIRAEDAAPADG